jgi:hypothetical protein
VRAFVHHGRSNSHMARELAVISVTVHPRCAKPAFRVPMRVVRPLYGLVARRGIEPSSWTFHRYALERLGLE